MATITLSGLSSTGLQNTYLWSTSDGNILTSVTESTIDVSSPGTYSLTVTDILGTSNTDTFLVSVSDVPTVGIISSSGSMVLSTNNPSFTLTMESLGNFPYGWKTDSASIVVSTASTKLINVAGTYSAYMQTSNGCLGASSIEVTGDPATDLTPPGIPTNLAVVDYNISDLYVSWDQMTDAVSYNVYRDNLLMGNILASNGPIYEDLSVTLGVTYSYSVSAIDSGGNTSVRCVAVEGIRVDDTPPSVPDVDTFSLVSGSGEVGIYYYDLNWDPSTSSNSTVASYEVYKDGALFGTTAGTSISVYADSIDLATDLPGVWKVRAKDVLNNTSEWSGDWQHGVTGLPPAPDTVVILSYTGESWNEVTWQHTQDVSSYSIANYEVWRKEGAQAYSLYAYSVTTDYLDATTSYSVNYCYKIVTVLDSGLKSGLSVEDCIWTQAPGD